MIPSFRTDMPGQTVQTQIRLLLEEQSDQGLHCLPFRLHRFDSLLYGREPHSSNFRVITTNFLGVRILRKFTVTVFFFYSSHIVCFFSSFFYNCFIYLFKSHRLQITNINLKHLSLIIMTKCADAQADLRLCCSHMV